MAIPENIFKLGTCLKKDFYQVLTNALVTAGWVNVSSLPSTDGDVFISSGNAGDKSLILNIRKLDAASNWAIDSTIYCQLSFRFVTSYTPGAAGVAGTFVRPNSWRNIYLYPSANGCTMPLDLLLTYRMCVDKNKFAFSLEYPPALNVGPIFVYLGVPDSTYCTESENRGMIFCQSGNYESAAANTVFSCDTPFGMASLPAPEALTMTCTLAPKNPNNSNKFLVSDIYYGNVAQGIRGKLDGVVMLPNQNVMNGDNIVIGSTTYYILVCQPYTTSSFASLALGIRII